MNLGDDDDDVNFRDDFDDNVDNDKKKDSGLWRKKTQECLLPFCQYLALKDYYFIS